ncbi:MAG: DUF5711 family protein [Eubacterium sp.]|nr:DUF5711 family protein [Eubacterium sp.]
MAKNYKRKLKRKSREAKDTQIAKTTKGFFGKTRVKVGLVILLVLLVVLAIYLFNRYKTYDGYKVVKKIETKSGESSKFLPFKGKIVKYSRNGISYLDDDTTVWDESYEMKNPLVDVCKDYLCVADKNANDIEIFTEDGKKGSVTTTYPISKAEVAEQGVVAALLKDKDVNYIEVFDKEGNLLVSHKSLLIENGYPLNFSLSDDGEKMIVSYVQVSAGSITSKVVFYNFGNPGKNKKDRIVSTFKQYKDELVPFVKFTDSSKAVAVSENRITIYKVGDEAKMDEEEKFKGEAQKVFYNDDYIGLVFKTKKGSKPYRVVVYNGSLSEKMNERVGLAFDVIKFADKNVLMYNDKNVLMMSLHGVEKFKTTFKKAITDMIPLDSDTDFLVTYNDKVEEIELD